MERLSEAITLVKIGENTQLMNVYRDGHLTIIEIRSDQISEHF